MCCSFRSRFSSHWGYTFEGVCEKTALFLLFSASWPWEEWHCSHSSSIMAPCLGVGPDKWANSSLTRTLGHVYANQGESSSPETVFPAEVDYHWLKSSWYCTHAHLKTSRCYWQLSQHFRLLPIPFLLFLKLFTNLASTPPKYLVLLLHPPLSTSSNSIFLLHTCADHA